jgi:DNA-binding GntR family transcriptional regulator
MSSSGSPGRAALATAIALPPSFPEYVRQLLRREIIEGRLGPDERVTERGLAERIGVSRTPIREAIQALEREGLIVRRRGKTTHVAPLMGADEARILYQIRVTLESYLTQQATPRLTAEQLETLRDRNDAFRELAARDGAEPELIDLDSRFHSAIYEASQEDFLLSIVESYWSRLIRELEKPSRSRAHPVAFAAAHELFAEQHERIVVALEKRNAAAARQAMAQHIRSAWRAIEEGAADDAVEAERATV